jgi:hypothetical protein
MYLSISSERTSRAVSPYWLKKSGVLARAFRPLAAGQQGRIPGQMAQQVERVGVGLIGAHREFLKADATLGQFPENFATGIGIGPRGLQIGALTVQRTDGTSGVLGVAYDLQLLAVGVEIVHEMADDLDFAAVDIELARLVRRVGQDDAIAVFAIVRFHAVFHFGLRNVRGRFDDGVDRFAALIDGDFLDTCRLAIEIRIGEVAGGSAGKIDDDEVFLAVIDLQARSTADDLLELRVRADDARQMRRISPSRH